MVDSGDKKPVVLIKLVALSKGELMVTLKVGFMLLLSLLIE